MKRVIPVLLSTFLFTSCATNAPLSGSSVPDDPGPDTPITQSLFSDKSASISEDGIQRVLDGSFKLPNRLRVSVVRLAADESKPSYYNYGYRTDETYLKTQQAYLDSLSGKLTVSSRITKLSVMPDLLIPKTPSFTTLREAAVRMQADVLVIYSIRSDIYSKYRLFSATELKAFATTQLILLDVRTGLIPFSATVTKDVLSAKSKADLTIEEAQNRVKKEAALQTILEIGNKVHTYLAVP